MRILWAVPPRLPITRPRSSGSTVSSSKTPFSSIRRSILTSSGLLTSDFTIYSINCWSIVLLIPELLQLLSNLDYSKVGLNCLSFVFWLFGSFVFNLLVCFDFWFFFGFSSWSFFFFWFFFGLFLCWCYFFCRFFFS